MHIYIHTYVDLFVVFSAYADGNRENRSQTEEISYLNVWCDCVSEFYPRIDTAIRIHEIRVYLIAKQLGYSYMYTYIYIYTTFFCFLYDINCNERVIIPSTCRPH